MDIKHTRVWWQHCADKENLSVNPRDSAYQMDNTRLAKSTVNNTKNTREDFVTNLNIS